MLAAGLLDQESVLAAMEQRLPAPDLFSLLAKVGGLRRAPRAVAKVLPVFVRMAAVLTLYSRYPEGMDAQCRWARRVARVFGERFEDDFDDALRLTAAGGGDNPRS